MVMERTNSVQNGCWYRGEQRFKAQRVSPLPPMVGARHRGEGVGETVI